jgi:hypothetical protein
MRNGMKNEIPETHRQRILKDLLKPLKARLRLMFSASGRVGWVTSTAMRGDKLCLLQGCSVVVVIRPRSDGVYTIVGDAFVDNVMSGELMLEAAFRWYPIPLY